MRLDPHHRATRSRPRRRRDPAGHGPGPAPQQAARPGAVRGRRRAAGRRTARLRADTPRLLNRLQVLAVTACVLFGVVAALLQVLAWQANGRAADNTEQVVRVQEIKSLLLRADALATNSFLVGGLEPAEARAEYDDAIDDVLRLDHRRRRRPAGRPRGAGAS